MLNRVTGDSRGPPGGTRARRDRRAMQDAVRRGLAPADRAAAWWTLSGAESLRRGAHYIHLVTLQQAPPSEWEPGWSAHFEAVEKDLLRTFPEDPRFHRGGALEGPLRRVLRCYAVANPSVGYCQSLNFLAGLVLQVEADEERAFWILTALCSHWLPHVHDTSLEGVALYQGVLLLYVKQRAPQLYAAIVSLEGGASVHEMLLQPPALLLPTTAWFMTLYISALPLEAVLVLWDNILLEGPPAIFSIGVHLLGAVAHKIVGLARQGGNHAGEIFQVVQGASAVALGRPQRVQGPKEKLLGKFGGSREKLVLVSQDMENTTQDPNRALGSLGEGPHGAAAGAADARAARALVAAALHFLPSERDLRAKQARVARARAELLALLERRARWGVDDARKEFLPSTGALPPGSARVAAMGTAPPHAHASTPTLGLAPEDSAASAVGLTYHRWRAKLRLRRKLQS